MPQHQPADAGGRRRVIGLAIAWRAAQAGMAVTVVDERLARGASWAFAGWPRSPRSTTASAPCWT